MAANFIKVGDRLAALEAENQRLREANDGLRETLGFYGNKGHYAGTIDISVEDVGVTFPPLVLSDEGHRARKSLEKWPGETP